MKDVLPTTVKLGADGTFAIGKIDWPEAKVTHDPVLKKDIASYEGEITVFVPVSVPAIARGGESKLTLTVRAQPCGDKVCLIPEDHTLTIPITIDPAASTPIRHPAIFGQRK